MPTGDPKLHAKWRDDGNALRFLKELGWIEKHNGLLCRPMDRPHSEIGEVAWEAVTYLRDEWDYDYIPHPDDDR